MQQLLKEAGPAALAPNSPCEMEADAISTKLHQHHKGVFCLFGWLVFFWFWVWVFFVVVVILLCFVSAYIIVMCSAWKQNLVSGASWIHTNEVFPALDGVYLQYHSAL